MEVLVAIIICGIGLLALLTLFPLGAMEMAQSVKFDRCGHLKHIAAAIANTWDIRQDQAVQDAMLRPDPTGTQLPIIDPDSPAYSEAMSYPVLIDPIGWHANQNSPNGWRDWVAGQTNVTPRRVTYALLDPNRSPDLLFRQNNAQYRTQQLHRWCVLQDEINFENYPGMTAPPGAVVERTPRYSWAFLAQMPKVRNRNQVNLHVILYSGRLLEEPQTGETGYSAYFTSGSPVISLTWNPTAGQVEPELRTGSWLLDGTMTPVPRGKFYRVVSVTKTGPTSMDVEVLTAPGYTGNGVIVSMENVIEVYDRGDD
jgi:hypothetical protein